MNSSTDLLRMLRIGAENTISTPWWQMPGLFLLALICLIGLIIAGYRVWKGYITSEKQRLEALVKERTRILEQEIEDHKQTEETLQEREQRYRSVIEDQTELICRFLPETSLTFVNEAYCRYFGKRQEELIGNSFLPLIVAEDRERVKQHFTTFTRDHSIETHEHRVLLSHGEIRWQQWTNRAIFDEHNNLVEFQAVGYDITDRKQAEEALRESETRFETFMEYLPANVTIKDHESRFLFGNKQMRSLFNTESWIGKTARDYFPPEIAENVLATDRQVLEQGSMMFEEAVPISTGAIRIFETRKFPIKQEHKPDLIGVISVDITERKQAESALRESEERYRAFSELTSDLAFVFQIGPDGTLIPEWLTDSFTQITGFPLKEAEALNWTGMIHPEDRPAVLNELQTVLGGQSKQGELRIVTRENAVRWLYIYSHPVWDEEQQRIVRIYGAAQDITDRKQAEKALHQAREEAEQANRAKGEFLASMSHELRTPLNSILGYAQLLERDESLSDKQRTEIGIIHRGGEHLLLMINEILDLSKIEARRIELEPVKFSFLEFLTGLVDMVQLQAEQKGILVVSQIDQEISGMVTADERRLRQILLNLLSNAIKFTDTGEVVFRVMEQGTGSRKQGARSSIRIRFQVEDQGIGIQPEDVEGIFQPFQQMGEKRFYSQGMGLGLAISQRFVRLMGSELYVKSTPGQGSTFWFDLNLPIEQEKPGDLMESTSHVIGFKLSRSSQCIPTILIADDQKENRIVLRDMLLPLGFEILEAVDGLEVLEKAQKYRPALILMDLMMPVIDGFEATCQIRQVLKLTEVVVIGVSAGVSPQVRQESLAAGCQGFLPKPVDLDELLACLQKHLHLEWIYEKHISNTTDGISDSDFPQFSVCDSQSEIIPPSREDLAALYELAVCGDIVGLREQAVQLATDPQLAPFVNRFEQLNRTFQMNRIKKFLELYMQSES